MDTLDREVPSRCGYAGEIGDSGNAGDGTGLRVRLLTEILDRTTDGFILLDARGEILFANAEARRICAARDGVGVQGRSLAVNNADFDVAVASVLARIDQQPTRAGCAHQVERPSGSTPYIVSLAAIVSGSAGTRVAPAERLLVTVIDPAATHLPSEACLVRAFGLTSAEARVCRPVAAGGDLRRVADELALSLATVRSHIRNVYNKLRVTSRMGLTQRLRGHVCTSTPILLDGDGKPGR